MKKWMLTFLMILFCGCVSPKYNYFPQAKEISEPPIGSTNTAYVGDSMLRQGKYIEHDAIFLDADIKVGILGEYTFTRGYYTKRGEDEKSTYFLPADGPDAGRVIVNPSADPVQMIRLDKKTGKFCAVTIYNLQDCTSKARYKQVKYSDATSDAFQQTLIYSGKVGDKINVGYREFSNNMARPAFNNDVEYDLSESQTIGYKGARIEVIKATNENITYKVLSNFNRAEY